MNPRALEVLVPGDLRTLTGGYGYDRRLIAGLRTLGWRVTVHRLDPGFPHPGTAALAQAHAVLAGLPDQAPTLIDGLALGAMPEVVRRHRERLQLLGLVHHPLAAEPGLAPEAASRLKQSERQALQAVRHVFVTSPATRQALVDYGVGPNRISVVEPGTDAAPLTHHPPPGSEIRMLCVATIIPRKGHDLLMDALAPLAHLRWNLTCVGSTTRSPATSTQLRAQLRRLGLERRVALAGEVADNELARLFQQADLFVLPTRYEGYGMAVAEALAHGLPVVSTRTGAIDELVGTRAGLLARPGDPDALREALVCVLTDPARLAALAAGAGAVRSTLAGWPEACARMAALLPQVTGCGAPPR